MAFSFMMKLLAQAPRWIYAAYEQINEGESPDHAQPGKENIMESASRQIRSLAEEAASKLARQSVSDVYDEFIDSAKADIDDGFDDDEDEPARGGDRS